MAKYRVSSKGKNYEAMADLVRRHHLSIAGHSVKSSRVAPTVFRPLPTVLKSRRSSGRAMSSESSRMQIGREKKRQAEVVRPGKADAATGAVSFVSNLNQYLGVDAGRGARP
jgi:hypothetical protein